MLCKTFCFLHFLEIFCNTHLPITSPWFLKGISMSKTSGIIWYTLFNSIQFTYRNRTKRVVGANRFLLIFAFHFKLNHYSFHSYVEFPSVTLISNASQSLALSLITLAENKNDLISIPQFKLHFQGLENVNFVWIHLFAVHFICFLSTI